MGTPWAASYAGCPTTACRQFLCPFLSVFVSRHRSVFVALQVTGGKVQGGRAALTVEPSKGGAAETLDADVVLVSIGARFDTC